jgi:hypothetical protein
MRFSRKVISPEYSRNGLGYSIREERPAARIIQDGIFILEFITAKLLNLLYIFATVDKAERNRKKQKK